MKMTTTVCYIEKNAKNQLDEKQNNVLEVTKGQRKRKYL